MNTTQERDASWDDDCDVEEDEKQTTGFDIKKKMDKAMLNDRQSLVNMNYLTTHIYITICHVCFKVQLNTQVGDHI